MKNIFLRIISCVAFFTAFTTGLSRAEDDKIVGIMKKAFKGDNSLYKKVATGKGTPDDNAKLVTLLKGLTGTKPPRGDINQWNQKTGDLIKAAEDVAAGKPNGMEALQMSGKCKSCHRDHKEEK